MFDTLHSRHSSESNACAALYVRCTNTGSGGKFCVLRRGTAWVWEYGTWVQDICCQRHLPPCIEIDIDIDIALR